MELQKLFKAQRVLDEHIVNTQGLKDVPLNNMILALIVELGEMSNEWQGFKHWKVNKQSKPGLRGEIADVLSFLLAIGNMVHHRKGLESICIFEKESIERNQYCIYDSITDQIIALISDFTDLWNYGEIDEGYSVVMTRFAVLTEMLGFTWDEIEAAYFEKNSENHRRQNTGY
ncbi:dUTP diphosphatase [Lysinibacillus antri]|uniref:dUTPase n=1 Tax=Lysinibacillus antri TaxID=2498145 RepID=A0A3S0P897_9BACI|nr:dUTP diphosphatase [Lysinibacillus antri]RUL56481.1 dUTPase [Lysinibacillus antri]